MSANLDQKTIVTARRNKLTFPRLLRSEWIKVFSLRSTWWLLALAIVFNLAIALGTAAGLRYIEFSGEFPPGLPVGSLSANVVESCGLVGQLLFIILAILVITNEYSSGQIRSSFIAAPRRRRVLIAKIFIVLFLCLVIFVISLGAAWAGSYLILADSTIIDLSLTSAVSLRILGGFLAEIALLGLLSFGLGCFIRSSAGSIATAVGLFMILPVVAALIRLTLTRAGELATWQQWIINLEWFLPTNAGGLVKQEVLPEGALFGPWEGLAILGAWTLFALILGFIRVAHRDA